MHNKSLHNKLLNNLHNQILHHNLQNKSTLEFVPQQNTNTIDVNHSSKVVQSVSTQSNFPNFNIASGWDVAIFGHNDIATYGSANLASCANKCRSNSQCKGFVVDKSTKENTVGCTLKKYLGNSLPYNSNKDTYIKK
jgi:hypothetical protein